jgi:tetratricopeptide (TPR) repeat protein
MSHEVESVSETNTDQLAASGYWPARAAKLLADGKYSNAVEICKEHVEDEPEIVSGRLIYATALYLAGRLETATDQFYRVLSRDPDNVVALKYLSDMKFASGDEPAAMAGYQRVLEIDPHCRGLKCDLQQETVNKERLHTISLKRGAETSGTPVRGSDREIPFYTETMGDLYLSQGYARLAARVFQRLVTNNDNPRLRDKLTEAESKIRDRESSHVDKTHQ